MTIGGSCNNGGGWIAQEERMLKWNGSLQERRWPWLPFFFLLFFFIYSFVIVLSLRDFVYDTILVLISTWLGILEYYLA